MTGQHLLLLLWTLWLVFALLSIGDLLGVILALVFGLLGAGADPHRPGELARICHRLANSACARGCVRGRRAAWSGCARLLGGWGCEPLWSVGTQSPLLQTIFGSVSFVGLVSVLYLRPTVPWKYRVDIPLMILVVIAVVAAEYALLAGSGASGTREKQEPDPGAGPDRGGAGRQALIRPPVTVRSRGKLSAETATGCGYRGGEYVNELTGSSSVCANVERLSPAASRPRWGCTRTAHSALDSGRAILRCGFTLRTG